MNDTGYAPELDRRSHTLLERHLVVGAHTYQITASGTGDDEVRLHLNGWDADGSTIGEFSGGISPADLPAVADALTSTLAGLVALRAVPSRRTPAPRSAAAAVGPNGSPRGGPSGAELPRRHPNQGTRWSPEDDERLVARFREGAAERSLITEFGRSRGGIRARLETLGLVEPGSTRLYRDRLPSSSATTAAKPESSVDPVPSAVAGRETTEHADGPAGGPTIEDSHGGAVMQPQLAGLGAED